MNNLPRRKKIRLKDYNYSSNGYYFITICSKERKFLFWDSMPEKVCTDIICSKEETNSVGADIIRPEEETNSVCTDIIRSKEETNSVGADIIRPEEETNSVGADIIRPKLSVYGKIIEKAINNIPKHYQNVEIDRYVIMPDHVHLILIIYENDRRIISAPTIMTVIGQMKRYVSKEIGFSIWQKSYYEHIIRDKKDYDLRIEYIMNNPAKYIYKNDDI